MSLIIAEKTSLNPFYRIMQFWENPESKYASNSSMSSKTGRGTKKKAADLAKSLEIGWVGPI